MAGRADDILFSIRADNKDIKKKLSEVQTDMKHMGHAGKKAGDQGAQGVNKLSRALKALVTGSIILIIVKGLYELGKAALFGSDQLEQQRIALETMTGSAKEAKTVLKEATAFAEKTPFKLDGVIASTKQLIGFQVESDQVVEVMKNLGNVAQGNQQTFERLVYAYGKLKTKGRATMEELNLFLEAGVPILDELAKKYNASTGEIYKMVETGKIGFEEVNEAIESMSTGTGMFAGMVDKQAKTLGGMFSTLLGKAQQAAISIGQGLTPAIQELFNALPDSDDEESWETIYYYARNVGKVLGTAVLIIKTWADALLGIPAIFKGVYFKIEYRINQLKFKFVDLMYAVGIGSEEAVHKAGTAMVQSAANYNKAQGQIQAANKRLKGDIQAIIDLWGKMDEKTGEDGPGGPGGPNKKPGGGAPGGKDKDGWNPWFDPERIQQDLEKIQQSLVDSYNPVQSLGNAFQGLEDASRQATYDMLWGEGGWKNFQKNMKEIFKRLVADVAYYTAKVIAMKVAVAAISGGGGGGLLASVLEKGRVPSHEKGRIPAYPTGTIPDDHFLAYIGAKEAVVRKEATSANNDILKWMNEHNGQRYGGDSMRPVVVQYQGKTLFEINEGFRNQRARNSGGKNYAVDNVYK